MTPNLFLLKIADALSDFTGYAAIRDHLPRAANDRKITLAVPGLVQVDSYSCAAVAGWMILRTFNPKASLPDFYAWLGPNPEYGAGTSKLVRALRASGIGVGIRHNLTFNHLCREIEHGFPVIVEIQNPRSDSHHLIVAYGFGRSPDLVFIANNSLPWIGGKHMTRKRFERIWNPAGNGLVCWGR